MKIGKLSYTYLIDSIVEKLWVMRMNYLIGVFRFLQERLEQLTEEKELIRQSVTKYKVQFIMFNKIIVITIL